MRVVVGNSHSVALSLYKTAVQYSTSTERETLMGGLEHHVKTKDILDPPPIANILRRERRKSVKRMLPSCPRADVVHPTAVTAW